MGQKNSVQIYQFSSLPNSYQKTDKPEIYELIVEKIIKYQPNIQEKQVDELPVSRQSSLKTSIAQNIEHSIIKQTSLNSTMLQQNNIPYKYLKQCVLILNKSQTKSYLNHLHYRNQCEFQQLLVQIPYGSIQKHTKNGYSKLNLYVDEIVLTLNQLQSLHFYDIVKILYIALLGFKYLYSYFGFFKIQANMIGFTRQGRVKVWLNSKLTQNKSISAVSNLNLKRYKQQESYMAEDLMTIFYNKVTKQTIPNNFSLLVMTNVKKLNSSRLSFSRVNIQKNQQQLSQSMVSNLETNLITDFSDGSFQKSLLYIQDYFNMERPIFSSLKEKSHNKNPQNIQSYDIKHIPKHKVQNFIASIKHLIKTRPNILQSNERVNLHLSMSSSQHYVKSIQKRVKFSYDSKQKTTINLSTGKTKIKFNTSNGVNTVNNINKLKNTETSQNTRKSVNSVNQNGISFTYKQAQGSNIQNNIKSVYIEQNPTFYSQAIINTQHEDSLIQSLVKQVK